MDFSKVMAIVSAAAVLGLSGCGKSADSSAAEDRDANAAEEQTLAEQLTDNLKTGNYAIDMVISGDEYGGDMPCKLVAKDGNTLTAMTYGGVYTEFYTIGNESYMLMPDICFYQATDEKSGLLDGLFVIGEGDTISGVETADGVTTEIYTSTDDSGVKDTYTYLFDEETGELMSLEAVNGEESVSVTVNSINFSGADIKLPDLTGWQDMADVEKLDAKEQMKLTLYYMGVTEEQLEESGYTYDDLAEMSDEELNEAFAKLGINIFG